MFNNIRIGIRLFAGFILIVLIMLTMAIVSYSSIRTMEAAMSDMYENRTVPIVQLSQVYESLLRLRLSLYREILELDDPKQYSAVRDKQLSIIAENIESYKATSLVEEEKSNLAKFEAELESYRTQAVAISQLIRNNHKDQAIIEFRPNSKILLTATALQDSLDKLISINKEEARKLDLEGNLLFRQSTIISIVLTVLSILISMGIGFYLSRGITIPLSHGVDIASDIAQGNLRCMIDAIYNSRRDEVGELLEALSAMLGQLIIVVRRVTESTDCISSASQQIADSSEDLFKRTESQAAALQQTASSMEQMTSTVKQNSDNAHHANTLALSAKKSAEDGGEVTSKAIDAMNDIVQSSGAITKIIDIINEIAFQTNLLALNAAVEAARAGEHGRGFSVVAGEVRKLAQRSAEAAKQIRALILDSDTKIKDGTDLVKKSEGALKSIIQDTRKASSIIAEMATATNEQAAGIEQINKAILQMDTTTQQNAHLVEQTASASSDLGNQAKELQELMRFFKV